jgi:uncharacterized membrane protein
MNNSGQSLKQHSPMRMRTKLLLSIAGLAFIGFADSTYLTADHYFALPLPCSILHGCDIVLSSVYSMVGPIPLALLGVVFYLTAMVVALYLYTNPNSPRLYDWALFGITFTGFVMSMIFEAIQAFLIHAFCLYCAISAFVATVMFVCGAWIIKIKPEPQIQPLSQESDVV